MKIDKLHAALILVDYQKAFDDLAYWGQRNNPQAEANGARVLSAWRKAGLPIFHIRHNSTSPASPLKPGHEGNRPLPFAAELPGEPVITKNVNSGFIGTKLEVRLRKLDIKQLVIMGISTDHCVSTTTRMAANLGFEVMLVGDACFTFDRALPGSETMPAELVHKVELAILSGEFAEIVATDKLLEQISSN